MTPRPTDRPPCPMCGEPMTVVKTRRKGPNIRVRHLGCRDCKYWRGGCLSVDTHMGIASSVQ